MTSRATPTKVTKLVGLGVCARDEEATIVATLSSIVQSVSCTPELYDWQLIVCVNGSTDGTTQAVSEWIGSQNDSRLSLCTLESPNLVEAQRTIWRCLTAQGARTVGFFDADILVSPNCIAEMLKAIDSDVVRAVYASSIPIINGNETLIQKSLNQYDLNNRVFSRRKHLHGRAFFLKEWDIPQTIPPLLADDIYLSCDLLLKFGENSIKQCHEARIYFNQISTLEDFFQSYRRRKIELRKCLDLNPSFNKLPPDQLNRKLVLGKLITQPPKTMILWLFFLTLRMYCSIRHSVESFMPGKYAVWRPTTSSKRLFKSSAQENSTGHLE